MDRYTKIKVIIQEQNDGGKKNSQNALVTESIVSSLLCICFGMPSDI